MRRIPTATKPQRAPRTVARPLDTQGFSIISVCCSPDGRWIAGDARPNALLLWDAVTLELNGVKRLRDGLRVFGFSPNGSLLVMAGWPDSHARLTRVPSLEPAADLPLIPAGAPPNRYGIQRTSTMLTSVSFTFDGRYLAGGCWDTHVKLWDLAD